MMRLRTTATSPSGMLTAELFSANARRERIPRLLVGGFVDALHSIQMTNLRRAVSVVAVILGCVGIGRLRRGSRNQGEIPSFDIKPRALRQKHDLDQRRDCAGRARIEEWLWSKIFKDIVRQDESTFRTAIITNYIVLW
jgi:hypothetical protein